MYLPPDLGTRIDTDLDALGFASGPGDRQQAFGLWVRLAHKAGCRVNVLDDGPRECILGHEALFVTVTETQGSAVRRHTDVSLWHVIELEHESQRLCPDPGEFDSVRWMSFDELLAEPIKHLDPHMHRFARKLRAASSDAVH